MTLATYKVLVQDNVNDYSTRAGNVIEQQLKEKYQEILRYTARFLVGTLPDTQVGSTSLRYVTPTAFMQVTDVQWKDAGATGYSQLDPIEESEYLRDFVNASTGTPNKWYVNGLRVYFERVPDTAGTCLITYVPVQNELTGSQVSIIPDRFTDVLTTGAIAGFKAYEKLPDAREYESQYMGPFGRQGRVEGLLGGMIQELSGNQRTKKLKFWSR